MNQQGYVLSSTRATDSSGLDPSIDPETGATVPDDGTPVHLRRVWDEADHKRREEDRARRAEEKRLKEAEAAHRKQQEEQAKKADEAKKQAEEREKARVKDRETRDWGEGEVSRGNCWRYASDQIWIPGDPRRKHFGLPGDVDTWDKTADGLHKILVEAAGATKTDKDTPCPPPSWKIAAVVSTAPPIDFHFYRQNSDGKWTHKPGNTKVRNVDASGSEITNPETCNRDHRTDIPPGPHYDKFVGYYCVK